MKTINLICEGESESLTVRCCQGAGIRLCKFEDFVEQVENGVELGKHLAEERVVDQMVILILIMTSAEVDQDLPVLDVIDFFSQHRQHRLHVEVS